MRYIVAIATKMTNMQQSTQDQLVLRDMQINAIREENNE